MARRKRQRGFTLVELLVVISIIGMLMALLLPAVQAAREAGRNNTCKSNLHNLALAMQNYEQNKKAYPGYANPLGYTYSGNPPTPSGGLVVSYIVPALSQLERSDLYALLTDPSQTTQLKDRFEQLQKTRLEFLTCPSSPADSTEAPLAYVCNAGVEYNSGDPPYAQLSPSNPLDAMRRNLAASGVFHSQIDELLTNRSIAKTTVSQDYVSSHDGTTNTIMLSENLQARSWMISQTVPPTSGNEQTAIAEGKQYTAMVWWGDGLTQNNPERDPNNLQASEPPSKDCTINSNKDTQAPLPSGKGQFYRSRPSSNHSGTVNVAFCDGNVRPISEEIGYNVYRQLMTPNNRATYAPLQYTINSANY